MSKGPQRIRGTQDIWGEDADRFSAVVAAFDRVRRLYGFQRIELPVFEATSVFARSIGETTDIVSKEMYSFEDRGGDSLGPAPDVVHRAHAGGTSDPARTALEELQALFQQVRTELEEAIRQADPTGVIVVQIDRRGEALGGQEPHLH